jgi:hypothetical protein
MDRGEVSAVWRTQALLTHGHTSVSLVVTDDEEAREDCGREVSLLQSKCRHATP